MAGSSLIGSSVVRIRIRIRIRIRLAGRKATS